MHICGHKMNPRALSVIILKHNTSHGSMWDLWVQFFVCQEIFRRVPQEAHQTVVALLIVDCVDVGVSSGSF